jgi:hypothetical protein
MNLSRQFLGVLNSTKFTSLWAKISILLQNLKLDLGAICGFEIYGPWDFAGYQKL